MGWHVQKPSVNPSEILTRWAMQVQEGKKQIRVTDQRNMFAYLYLLLQFLTNGYQHKSCLCKSLKPGLFGNVSPRFQEASFSSVHLFLSS